MEDQNAITITVEPEIRLGTLAVKSPAAMVERAAEIATALGKVVEDRKLYTVISGKKFVRVEGWSTLGAMLGVIPREVSVTEHESGDFESVVELVRVTDGAMVGRGSAIVGSDEPTWNKRPRYARRSMSITRATGKAYRLGFSWIMNLAGYEPTPAEEMQDTGPELKDDYSSTQNGGNGKVEHPAPVPDENAKPARLKYQPFVGWCNTWIVDHRASKYGKEVDAGEIPQANMHHVLARVGKLGYPEVNADNVEAVKRDLQKYIERES